MTVIVAVLGVLIVIVGGAGVVNPAAMIRFVNAFWGTRRGLYVAVVLRLVMGVILIVITDDTRFPLVFRGLGALALIGAVLLTVLGFKRMRSLLAWWSGRSAGFIRAWCVVAIVFGGFLVYAVS